MLDRVSKSPMERVFDRKKAKTTAILSHPARDGEYCDGAWEYSVTSSIEDLVSRVGKARALAFLEAHIRMMRL